MVSENRQRVGGKRATPHMKHCGQQFSGYLIHVRHHQHQSLRGGKGRGQSTGRQCAVDCTGRSEFTLHLPYFQSLPHEIATSGHAPLLGCLAHRGDRSDGINCRNVAQRVGHVCRRGASVKYLFFHNVECVILLKMKMWNVEMDTAAIQRPIHSTFHNL